MKRIIAIMIIALILITGASCSVKSTKLFEIALISPKMSLDSSTRSKEAYEAICEYATKHNISYKYYVPMEESESGIIGSIQLAVNSGAKIIVCCGISFEVPVYKLQEFYPNVKFIMIDAEPYNDKNPLQPETMAENTLSIFFNDAQAGFIAGYAMMKEGITNLGFVGGYSIPSNVNYGFGFIQGIEYGAKKFNIKDVKLNYHYTGDLNSNIEKHVMASSWYKDGVEAIFVCGEDIINSICAAAKNEGGLVIASEVDRIDYSSAVCASANKDIYRAVYSVISSYYLDEFEGNTRFNYGVEEDYISMSFKQDLFSNFTIVDYNEIYEELKTNKDGLSDSIVLNGEEFLADPTKLKLENVDLHFFR